MIATYLKEFLGMFVQELPRLFLLGAPFLVIACGIAAVLDAKLPWRRGQATDGAIHSTGRR